ncbi:MULTISPECIES: hypothetical protein [Cytobacillus]|nr:hypothetical protein [Cytobacillus stercorigallinarum]
MWRHRLHRLWRQMIYLRLKISEWPQSNVLPKFKAKKGSEQEN